MRTGAKPPIRVGHLLTSLCVGGIERFVLNLQQEVSRGDCEIVVYSWIGDDPWRHEFESRGIRVIPLGGANRLRSPLAPWRFLRAWLRLAQALRTDRIDILHTHDFLPSLVGRTASLCARVPHRVVTLHNLYDWWPEWAFRINRVLARRTDAITCVSESVRDYFIRREGLPPDRYLTILNGVDAARFRPDPPARNRLRAELGILPDEILIGSAGSITTRKAQHLMVPAAAALIARGVPLQIRIFGANHNSPQAAETELLELIRTHGIGDRFQVLPPRQDMPAVYNALDIHCMSSIAEGLSLASIEALLAGTLCVYSDIGPFREVVRDGENGFLFRSGDSADLERALQRAIALLPESASLRDKASREGREAFGLDRMGRSYLELYRELSTT